MLHFFHLFGMAGEGNSCVDFNLKNGDKALGGRVLPSSWILGAGRLEMSCLREMSSTWFFFRSQYDLPACASGYDVFQCHVDAVHCVLPVLSVTGEGKGAVTSVSMGLGDKLQNVIEIDIPQ